MKTQYNKIVAGAFALSILVSPFAGFAAETKVKGGSFCNKIDAVTEKINTRLVTHLDKFAVRKNTRIANISKRRVTRDENRADHREIKDIKVDTRISNLTAKADTEAKKLAVVSFEQSVNSAISQRRATVDEAVLKFRNGVDNLITTKFNSIDNSAAVFKQSVNEAIVAAKNSCANGTDSEIVRTTMRNSIKVAQDKFKTNRIDTSIEADINALVEIKRQSIDGAVVKFKADMEKAKADLKIAFGA
jgi:hypothetical protein